MSSKIPAEPDASEISEHGLDPANWEQFRALAHRALDDAIDSVQNVRERPVWKPVPPDVKHHLAEPVPSEGVGLEQTYREFAEWIFPYPTGNIHPRFWGWVH